MDNIGSTARAPNTPSVQTGSVEAINAPKIKHSVTERLRGSNIWSLNRDAIRRPTRRECVRSEREGLTDQEDVDESAEHSVDQNGSDVLEEDSLCLHVEPGLEDDDWQQEQRKQRRIEARVLFIILPFFLSQR